MKVLLYILVFLLPELVFVGNTSLVENPHYEYNIIWIKNDNISYLTIKLLVRNDSFVWIDCQADFGGNDGCYHHDPIKYKKDSLANVYFIEGVSGEPLMRLPSTTGDTFELISVDDNELLFIGYKYVTNIGSGIINRNNQTYDCSIFLLSRDPKFESKFVEKVYVDKKTMIPIYAHLKERNSSPEKKIKWERILSIR